MNLGVHLSSVSKSLTEAGSNEAAIEAEVILRHITGLDRVSFFLELNRELSISEEASLTQLLQQRLRGVPLPYLTGIREFYGLEFYVNQGVLIPRPETELLVEKTLQILKRLEVSKPLIADIGTGCGAIAISLAKELPEAKLIATDISKEALEVARINCKRHGVHEHITFIQGNLLEQIPAETDMVVANLPYVRECEVPLNTHEPRIALDGGEDGVTILRQFIKQFSSRPTKALAMEIGAGQVDVVTELIHRLLPRYTLEVDADLGGIERVVSALYPSCLSRPA